MTQGGNPVINVGFTSDIDSLIREIKTKFGNMDVGLTAQFEAEIKEIYKLMEQMSKGVKNIMSGKLNTTTFNKAQADLLKKVNELEIRTTALEEGMSSLINTMSKADGGKFASQIQDASRAMQNFRDVTKDTVDAIADVNKAAAGAADINFVDKDQIKDLKEYIKLLKEIRTAADKDSTLANPKDTKEAIKQIDILYNKYMDLFSEMEDIEDNGIASIADERKLAAVQKQLVELGSIINDYVGKSADLFGDDFWDSIIPNSGVLGNLVDGIDETLEKIEKSVKIRIKNVSAEINQLESVATETAGTEIKKQLDSGSEKLTIPVELGTKVDTLVKRALEVIESIQSKIDQNPVEVNMVFVSGYKSRKNQEILEQLQQQINEMTDGVVKGDLTSLLKNINQQFSNDLNLHIKSDVDDTEKKVRAGIKRMQQAINDADFYISPNVELQNTEIDRLQSELDKAAKGLILTLTNVRIDPGGKSGKGAEVKAEKKTGVVEYSKEAAKIAETVDHVVNDSLKPFQESLASMSGIGIEFASQIERIVTAINDLNSAIQAGYGPGSKGYLDQMFAGLQERTQAISGALKGEGSAERIAELKEIISLYKEYQELGGKSTIKELGGDKNVQQWYRRNAESMLEAARAGEQLADATDDVAESTQKIHIDPEDIAQITSALERLSIDLGNIQEIMTDGSLFESLKKLSPEDTQNIENVANALRGLLEAIPSEKTTTGFTEIKKFINTFGKESGIEKIEKAAKGIKTLREALNERVSENSLLSAIQKLAEQGENLKNLATVLKATRKQVETAQKATSRDGSSTGATQKESFAVDKIAKKYQQLTQIRKQYLLLQEKVLSGTATSTEEAKLHDIERIYKQINEDVDALNTELGSSNAAIEKQREYLKEMARDYGTVLEKYYSSASNKIDKNIFSRDNQGTAYLQGFQEEINQAKDAVEELKASIKSHTDTDTPWSDEELRRVGELRDRIDEVVRGLSNKNNIYATATQVSKLLAKVNKDIADNGAMPEELMAAYKKLQAQLQNVQYEGDDTTATLSKISQLTLKDLNSQFASLHANLEESDQKGKTLLQTIKSFIFSKNAQFIAQFFSFQDILRYARTAIDTITELDTALVDLRKTAKMSTSQLNDFYYSSNDVAKQMGVTTQEIIEQAANWSRLGYNTAEAATGMAKISSQFASISPGMSTETAQEGLVSIMKGFNIDVADAEREVLDNINQIGNNFATSNDQIVAGLERSSSAMAAANNSLEETISLFTAGQEITQDAEKMGNALRTISMRIRGYDEETEELSEEYENLTGVIADLTKTADQPGGVSLFTDATKQTYKSTYEILKDIAGVWNDLTDKNQAQLLEKLFGKTRANQGAAILQNFQAAEEAMKKMEDAAGSADREMSIIEDSLEYKINALKETWVGIIQNLVDRGVVGDIVDALTTISEAIDKITDSGLGLMPIIGAITGGVLTKKGHGRGKILPLMNMPCVIDLRADTFGFAIAA